MSIYLDRNSIAIVQGITGREGLAHANRMREYGTTIVGGVTPGKGGQTVEGFAVFDTRERSQRTRPGQTSASSSCRRRSPLMRCLKPQTQASV